MRWRFLAGRRLRLVPFLAWLLPLAAHAEPVTLAGITFSDELGGVVLHRGWGRGTPDDPFVLVEDITDDGPAILVVRGLRGLAGNGAAAPLRNGFALRKIVTNRTGFDWHAFELELRQELAKPSSYEDGLSFAQATLAMRPFLSDRYVAVEMIDEPIDAVSFTGGLVRPGETVSVSAMITDYTPGDMFFLLQRRESPSAALDPRAGGS